MSSITEHYPYLTVGYVLPKLRLTLHPNQTTNRNLTALSVQNNLLHFCTLPFIYYVSAVRVLYHTSPNLSIGIS